MRRLRQLKRDGMYYVSSNFHHGILEYITDDVKNMLLKIIYSAVEKFRITIKNLCIMNTHFHVEIKTLGDTNLSDVIKYIKQYFTQWFNKRIGRKGTAWEDRFFSRIIETVRALIRVFNYIRNDSVKAGIVRRPEDYEYYRVIDDNLTIL